MPQDNLTAKQNDYAVFLPAISGFYATFIGKQRDPASPPYVDPVRMPSGLTDMEMMNWLDANKGLFPYKWSLYSGGHANLDLTKQDWSEDMVRNRDPNTLILGDSGGFQIAKGLWEGEWRDPTSAEVQQKMADLVKQGPEVRPVLDKNGQPVKDKKGNPKTVTIDHAKNYQKLIDAAQKKREAVLKWLDGVSNYGMILDIPTWVIHDKKASAACGITTLQEAVDATKYNNDYFMKHRKGKNNGGTKFLNVLQGDNHASAEDWYQTMKVYCDPKVYPDTHFDGWAMGGQNMCDVHLILKRLVALRHDGLLQEGIHDWMHFLGTSKLEWAVLLTDIQRAVRRYVNPAFTISFDCASPFLATANGQVYHHIDLPHEGKWCYRMSPIVDDKKYSTDTRPFGPAVLADKLIDHFDESPISRLLQMKDICIYKPGDVNKIGKEGKTSWDSFSYALLMGHNVWMHIESVQRANREYDAGHWPKMMKFTGTNEKLGDNKMFKDIVDAIFATSNREESEAIIEHYSRYWMDIPGTRGFKGKNTVSARPQFNNLFEVVDDSAKDSVQSEHGEDFSEDEIAKLDELERNG
jgi:hypothetical protein